jgi:hypothetical protein
MGIIDFDRVIMINLDLAMEAMYCQIITPFLHFTICYIVTIHFGFGIIGAGLSGVITNLFIWVLQIYIINNQSNKGPKITEIDLWDKRIFENINEFLKLAIPSTLIALTECSAYYSIIIISGLISLTN